MEGRVTVTESHRKITGIGRDVGEVSENRRREQQSSTKTEQGEQREFFLLVPIYQIPSVFFRELVERDRGFRMILMSWLFLCTRYMCENKRRQGPPEPSDQPQHQHLYLPLRVVVAADPPD